jgi:hypothetical protein
VKGIVILFCIAGLLLAVTPANAAGEKKTDQTPVLQQSSGQSNDNSKTVAPVEVKKEATPQPSYTPEKAISPSPEPSPVNRVYTAPVVQSYFNYNSSNQGGGTPPANGGGGNEAEHGRSGGGYHGHSGYSENPWRYGGFRSEWDFWGGPGLVFVPDYQYDYAMPVPYASSSVRLDRGVYVQFNASDAIGSSLAYSVSDHARADNLLPVSSPDQASLELFITSADEDPTHPGALSAVSVTYIWLPGYRFITSQVMNVGSERVEDAAGAVADYATQLIKTYRH